MLTQWWWYGLTAVSILFTSLVSLYYYSGHIEKFVKSSYTYVIDMPMADGTIAMTTMVGEVESTSETTPSYQVVDKLISRIFIVIPISCSALYLISNIPGYASPSWFNILLQVLTYGSAAIFYLFVKNDDV